MSLCRTSDNRYYGRGGRDEKKQPRQKPQQRAVNVRHPIITASFGSRSICTPVYMPAVNNTKIVAMPRVTKGARLVGVVITGIYGRSRSFGTSSVTHRHGMQSNALSHPALKIPK